MLSLNADRHYTGSERIYCRDNKDLWVLRKVEVYNAFCSQVTMERINSDWSLSGEVKKFHGDEFMRGSGFGGQPYLILEHWHRFNGSGFYRILD